jgi:hypothetical protein
MNVITKEKMMRLSLISVFAVLTMFFVSSTASAIEFSVLTSPTVTINAGDSTTIDIGLANASLTSNVGVVGTITGLTGAFVESGEAAGFFFVGFCSPSNCFAGINTNDTAFYDSSDLSAGSSYIPGGDQVTIISALALSATSANGAIDPGLDGALNVPSERDVTITINFPTPGVYNLLIGGTYGSGGNQPITSTASVVVNVVPEPGTALLMGLGLAGLAAAGRRK